MTYSQQRPPRKPFPSGLRVVFCIGILTLLVGCVTLPPPPQYESVGPLDDTGNVQMNVLNSTRNLGVMDSENSRKSMYYLETIREIFRPIEANTDLMNDVDPHYLPEGLKKILESSFKDIIVVENLDEAEGKNIDLVMTSDIRIKVGGRSGEETSVEILGIFMNTKGEVLDKVSGRGTATVPYPAKTPGFKLATNTALKAFSKNLNERVKRAAAVPEVVEVAAGVDPQSVRIHDTVNLGLTYSVKAGTNEQVTVREDRTLEFDGKVLPNYPVKTRKARASGSYSTAYPQKIPPTARPGIYRYEAKVCVAEDCRSDSATFEVVR